MPFTPLHDHVLVRCIGQEERPAGWFFIADSARNVLIEGEVVRVGAGARGENGDRVGMDVKTGDRILFSKRTSAELMLDGEDLFVLKESEIFGLIV